MIDTAVVVCPRADIPEASLLGVRVGGLPLFARTLLTARQAGVERFVVVASEPQQAGLRFQLERDVRLRGRVRWAEPAEALPAPADCLLLLPTVLLEAGALRRWIERAAADGSLIAAESGGGPLVVPARELSACVEAALGGVAGVTWYLGRLRGQGPLCRVPWEGIDQHPLRSVEEVPEVEHRMIAAFRSPEDGPIVDRYVNRTLSARLSRRLVAWPVTPNQLTVASLVAGLLGAWVLHLEGVLASLAGLVLFQLSMVLDHVDGEVARLKFQFSSLGKWLDNFSDHVVGLAVIACLTWRVAVSGTAAHLAILGLAAAIGVTGSFLVVFWWSLSGRKPQVRRTAAARLVAPALSALANRDGFCLALWATVLPGHPAWFLWALALGANAYWMVWLLTYGLPPSASRR
jgi:phosphatidylglycerophosphate synthase